MLFKHQFSLAILFCGLAASIAVQASELLPETSVITEAKPVVEQGIKTEQSALPLAESPSKQPVPSPVKTFLARLDPEPASKLEQKASVTEPATVRAREGQDANEANSLEEAAKTEDPCYSNSQMEDAIDKAFDYLNTKFCQPAIWFDSFFVDDRVEDDARAGTIIRWYNDFSYYAEEGFKYRANLNARLNLPGASKRLKLILDSTGEDDPFSFLKSPDDNNDRDIGLRYDWYAKGRVSFNIKANLKPKLEARWRYTYPISDSTVTRLTQKIYQEKKVTGESTEFDIEHAFNETFVGRWSAVAQYENRNNGWEFGSSVKLYQYINNKQALSYQASIYGVDEPYHYVKNASISATYRQNFIRDWLFFAVTPEYRWSKEDELSERINQVVLTFTLEVLFQNV